MKAKKAGTVALIIQKNYQQNLELIDKISDDHEIQIFEEALKSREPNPLEIIYEMRQKQTHEDEEFGNYIEDLLSKPFLKPEIQEHGIQWLKSKIRIEEFQKAEQQAVKTIAEYAFKCFLESPQRTDFFLAGAHALVRIRIFMIAPLEKVA